MNLPWGALGLPRFVAEAGDDRVLFVEGRPQSETPESDWDELPHVAYDASSSEGSGSRIDLGQLVRALYPTMADHGLPSMCSREGIVVDGAEAVGELTGRVLLEALRVDREVIGLLGQLFSGPLSGLCGAMLMQPAPPSETYADPATPLDARPLAMDETIDKAFGSGGSIARGLAHHEIRSGQIDMARRVADVFERGGALSVEAGPGTGKTFAYLVPAIRHIASHSESRVVICTRTKQLQEQLFGKDLPFLKERMAPDLEIALLKGRENYLCLRRWESLLHEMSGSLDRERLASLTPLVRWIQETETGDIEENAAFLASIDGRELWAGLGDSPHHCVGAFCAHVDACFSIRARRRARKAELVVVNHSLLLSDVGTGNVILGKYRYLVIDEAHAFESAARAAFTLAFSQKGVDRVVGELGPDRGRRTAWFARVPIPAEEGCLRDVAEAASAVRAQTRRALLAVEALLPRERRGRLPEWTSIASEIEGLRGSLRRLESAMERVLERLSDEPESLREGEGWLASLREFGRVIDALSLPEAENMVHWYERELGQTILYLTPLDVASILSERLYPLLDVAILTSATLSLAGDFAYIHRALGLEKAFDRADGVVVESPFSYRSRMRILVPEDFPSVQSDGDTYADALASLLVGLHRRLRRNGLVLFTSYELLQRVRERIHHLVPTLAQGVDGSRSKLVERFRSGRDGMLLLGVDSFWEGIDLPGEQLEYLVVTRLPFAVPSDPVQSALSEEYLRRGEDPFVRLALPQGILRLRQGVGRLIRTQKDRGVVVLTDDRILKRGYGKRFVASLPAPLERYSSTAEVLQVAGDWFAHEGELV